MIATPMNPVFTVGHSNHSPEVFVALLQAHQIQVLADVRSQPASRYLPWVNRDRLTALMTQAGIRYLFMGDELGGRPSHGGAANYGEMATSPHFRQGIARLARGATQYRIALMCAEKDPAECHRGLLIGRELQNHIPAQHILADGQTEDQAALEQRLMAAHALGHDLWRDEADAIADAYRLQSMTHGWQGESNG